MNGIAALLKKDLREMANIRRIVREQSSFKVFFIIVFATVMVAGLTGLFAEGFYFMDTLGGVGLMLVYRLFALFFLGLGVMLAMSSIVTSFTTFFRSDETAFLMLQPLSLGQITIYKFIQSAFFASWAFFFTIIPFIVAYAWHERLPFWFIVWATVYSFPLVLICTGLGTMVCMAAARWLPRGRVLYLALLLVFVAGGAWLSQTVSESVHGGNDANLVLARLIPGLRVASHPLWPSWWVSEGILALTREQWARGILFLLLLAASVLLVGMLVELVGRALFYESWQRVQYSGGINRRRAVLFRPMERLLRFLASDLRGLIVKDLRLFFRDPAQWSQGLIFFGLLALYFLNLRNLQYHVLPPEWRNLIAFLNVFSMSAVMCSFGSRFVYPQLSLEGHGFWVVGLSPTTMGRVLLSKFLVALAGMLALSVSLMYLSTAMLAVPRLTQLATTVIAVAMSFAVSGLSTGLGALFLDLKQKNPAAIVSGFGGTLNLVLSLVFMFAAILPFGLVFHLHFMHHLGVEELYRGLAFSAAWLVAVTVLATLLPLGLGARSLRRREY